MDVLTARPGALASNERDGILDIQRITNMIRRRIVPIGVTMVIIMVLTILAYMRADPMYSASARLAIDRRIDEVVPSQTQSPALVTDSSSVDTEVQIITSPRVIGDVVDKLNLTKSPSFIPPQMAEMGEQAKRDLVIAQLRSAIGVRREGLSYGIDISYTSGDRVLTAAIVNGVAEAYVDGQKSSRSEQRDEEIKLLRTRIDDLRSQVEQSEARLAQYRGSTTLMDIDKDGSIAQGAIAGLNSQLAQARADEAVVSARAASAARGNVTGIDGASSINSLRAEQAKLSADRAQLAQQYGPKFPQLQSVTSQLEEVNRQLELETKRVSTGLATEAQAARDRSSAIAAAVGRQKSELASANTASVRLGELQREAEASRTLYQGLLERYRQATVSQGTEQSRAYIIAKAAIPLGPSSPNLAVYIIGGLLASLIAALGVTVVLEMLENGFATRTAVEEALAIPVLASIPDLRSLEGGREVAKSPLAIGQYLVEHRGSVFSESFRSIRTSLKVGQRDQLARSIAITSALPDEGKTTAALSLARSAAMSGLKVVLIDCDVRRRASSGNLQEIEYGLIEVLKGEVSPEQALVLDRRSGVSVLPQKAADAADYDMMASQEMRDLIARLSNFFDLVILDTAPVLAIADARAVSAMADRTVLVVRWRKTPSNAVKLALGQLERAGAVVAGAVLSQVDIREQSRTGVGDEMYYFRSYKKYYTS